MTGQRPSVSCPRTRAPRATGQKRLKTLDPRIHDSQRRRPKSGDEAAAARVLQRRLHGIWPPGRHPSVSCPHAGIQAERQKAAETPDPRIRGDDSQRRRPKSTDEAAAAWVYNVRITELGPRGLPWRLERLLYDAQNPNSVFQIGFLTHEARRACRKDSRHQAREGMDLETHHR